MSTFAAKGAGAMPADNVIKFQPRRTPEPNHPTHPPAFNVPAPVLAVIAVLVVVHVALWLGGDEFQIWSRYALAFDPARLGGDVQVAAPVGAQIWSFLTYALLHGDAFHLGSNSIWLLIFSTPVIRRLGLVKYLVLLVVTSIAGATAMLAAHWGTSLQLIGASGAVSGLLAAVTPIMYAPGFHMASAHNIDHRRLQVLSPRQIFQDRKALAFTLMFLVLTLITAASSALSSTGFMGGSQIAWEAHLGGFIAGFFMFYLLDRKAVSLH
jgi:membrane associated rhomboid family serine protease